MNKKAFVLNCRIEPVDMEEALSLVRDSLDKNLNCHVVTINPEMIMNAQKDKAFFDILNSSDLNIMDGVGVKIALGLQGIKKNQIRGVDFSRELIKLASQKGYRLAFLGAKEEIITEAQKKCLEKYPNLNFVYVRNGYFEDENLIIEEIKEKNPQILLVGLGSPRQEELIYKLKNVLQGCIMVGVGGSFDVFSGVVKESPMIFRKLGLEWLYRTVLQPERFKRIFPVLPIFLIKCIMENVIKKG